MAALWSNSHQSSFGWGASINIRLFGLDLNLKTFQQWIAKHSADLSTSAPFKGVFLAPEYYFTKPDPGKKREPLDEAARLQLERNLLSLSNRYPEILIVPGTVFYAKPLVRGPESSQFRFDPATGTRTLLKTSDPDRRDRINKKVKAYIVSVPAQRSAADADLRRWAGTGFQAGAHHVPSLQEIRASVLDPSKDPWIVRNTAYLLLGGRRIAKYDKQSDWGEAIGKSPDDLAFVPGVHKQAPEIGGIRFGTEVCFDHGNGMLARRNITPLHFHLLVSDWVRTSLANMAMSAKGYFLHASTNYQESCVWWRDTNGALQNISVNPAYWKENRNIPGSPLDAYVVPLPPPLAPPKPIR